MTFTCPVFAGNHDIKLLYNECRIDTTIPFEVFRQAMTGFERITQLKKKSIITIIDFSRSSQKERFFVIDIVNKKLLYSSLVAHGKNSGENFAENFSNEVGSLKSSIGFFITAETYYGRHGYSLRLDGLESGINDNARKRDIVIHGADYVNSDLANLHGRIGRSWGCPALPLSCYKEIIDLISNGSCLFIYADDKDYLKKSKFLTGITDL